MNNLNRLLKKSVMQILSLVVVLSANVSHAVIDFTHPYDGLNKAGFNTSFGATGFDLGSQSSYKLGEASETVDPHKGSLTRVYVDYVFPGNGGMDLPITRVYQNLQNGASHSETATANGGEDYMGIGWSLHFGRLWLTDVKNVSGFWEGKKIPSLSATQTACDDFGLDNAAAQKNPVFEAPDGSKHTVYSITLKDTGGVEHQSQFITGDHWFGRCLQEAEDLTGDGGLVLFAPSGLKYTFNKYGPAAITSPVSWVVGAGSPNQYPKLKYTYNVTKIEDMNGNAIDVDYEFGAGELPVLQIKTVKRNQTTFSFSYQGTKLHSITGLGVTLTYNHSGNQLMSVDIGGEGHWDYQYYAAGDGIFSLKEVVSPLGRKTEYTYVLTQFTPYSSLNDGYPPKAIQDGIITVGVGTKNVSGPGIPTETTTYEYIPGAETNDITNVSVSASGGVGYSIQYEHIGYGATPPANGDINLNMWKRGLLVRKVISGQTETYEYDKKAFIAPANTWQSYPNQVQTYTWLPLLTKKTIQRSGATYETAYSYAVNSTQAADVAYIPSPWAISMTNPVVSQVESGPSGSRATEFFWFPSGKILKYSGDVLLKYKVSGNGHKTGQFIYQKDYDLNTGRLLTEVDNYRATKFGYDGEGNVITVTNPAEQITTYDDYHAGTPKTIGLPDGTSITRSVDDRGNILTELVASPNDGSYTIGKSYDTLNRVKSLSTPSGSDDDIGISYTPNTVHISRGSIQEYKTLNANGQVLSDTVNGVATEYAYDNLGNQTYVSDADGGDSRGIESKYDIFNQLKSVKRRDDSGTASSYEYSGESVSISRSVTGLGSFSDVMDYHGYGSPDNKYLVRTVVGTGAGSIETILNRDTAGQIHSVSQNGVVQNYTYSAEFPTDLIGEQRPDIKMAYCIDGLGRKARTVKTTSAYDPASACSAGPGTVPYGSSVERVTFDNASRIISLQRGDAWSDNEAVLFTYNKFGKLKSASRTLPYHEYTIFTNDGNGNITGEYATRDDFSGAQKNYNIGYHYDGLDHLESVDYPDGSNVNFAPDLFGRATQAIYSSASGSKNLASNIQYWSNGQLKSYVLGNGLAGSVTQTATGSPLPQNLTVSGSVLNLNYTYDGAGNPTDISGTADLSRNNIQYDGASRLLSVDMYGTNYGYTYSPSGDIGSTTVSNKGTCNYSYSSNRLNSVSAGCRGRSYSISYDYSGNVAGTGSSSFVYNQAGLIKSSNGSEYARYDLNGNRFLSYSNVWSDSSLVKRELTSVYGKSGKLYSDMDAGNYRNYVYVAGQMIAAVDQCQSNTNYAAGMCPNADDDGDGLTYKEEVDLGSYPFDADSDDDGLNDKEELNHGTDPMNPDSDHDGGVDGDDPLPLDASVTSYFDNSFNANGRVITQDGGLDYNTILELPNGKTLFVGRNLDPLVTSKTDVSLVKVNSDGSLDQEFNGAGTVLTSLTAGDDIPINAFVQSDGKIVVVAKSSNYYFSLIRYNQNGSVDTGFGTSGNGKVILTDQLYPTYPLSAAKMVDDRIVLIGRYAIARLNVNGSVDTTLNDSGVTSLPILNGCYDRSTNSSSMNDGSIIFPCVRNGYPHEAVLVKIKPDGSFDPVFGNNGQVSLLKNGDDIYQLNIKLVDSKRVFVSGVYGSYSAPSKLFTGKFDTDGMPDPQFGAAGNGLQFYPSVIPVGSIYGILPMANDKTILTGSIQGGQLLQLDKNGGVDLGFGNSGRYHLVIMGEYSNNVHGSIIQKDGKIVIAGGFNYLSYSDYYAYFSRIIIAKDTDGDGVYDNADWFPSDPSETLDNDSDGIGNNSDPDDDNDGVLDVVDNCRLVANQNQQDFDGDGIGDVCDQDDDNDSYADYRDYYPYDASKFVAPDTDNDGTKDPWDTDDDNDGVLDINDAFPLDPTESSDVDHDGVGDNMDPDIDGDGILNNLDNCTFVRNPDQHDLDGDSAGDVCDADIDGDGLSNVDELTLQTNPWLADTDGDGLSDGDEVNVLHTLPLNRDTDGDGVSDNNDAFPLNSAASLDTDHDGMPDNWNHPNPYNCAADAPTCNQLTLDADDDNDGVPDTIGSFADTDGDGVSDGIELQIGTNPIEADAFIVNVLAHRTNLNISDRWIIESAGIPGFNASNTVVGIYGTGDISGYSNGTISHLSDHIYFGYLANSSQSAFALTLTSGGVARKGIINFDLRDLGADLRGNIARQIVISDGQGAMYSGGSGNNFLLDGPGSDALEFLPGDGQNVGYFNNSGANRKHWLYFGGNLHKDNVRFAMSNDDMLCSFTQSQTDSLTLVNFAKDTFGHAMTAIAFNDDYESITTIAVDDFFVMPQSSLLYIQPSDLMVNDFSSTRDKIAVNIPSLTAVTNLEGGTPYYESGWGWESIELDPVSSSSVNFSYRVTNHDPLSSTDGHQGVAQIVQTSGDTIAGDLGIRNETLMGQSGVNETIIGHQGNDTIMAGDGPDTISFAIGDGTDKVVLEDTDSRPGESDSLFLASPITRLGTTLVRDKWDLLVHPDSLATDEIRLVNYFSNPQWTHPLLPYGIRNFSDISFDVGNGLPMSHSDVVAAIPNSCAYCGGGADTFNGTPGNDIVYGWAGNDELYGGPGDDQLFGDEGDDHLYPGSGNNLLAGGAGQDTYVLDANSGANTIENFDLTTGAASANYGYPTTDRDRIEFPASVVDSDVRLSRDKDDLIVSITNSSTSRVLDFFAASDFAQLDLYFVNGGVTWDGNCVDYSLIPTQHCIKNRVLTDVSSHEVSTDQVVLQGYSSDDIIHGGIGDDTIKDSWGNNELYGEGGNDVINGGMGDDLIHGGDGNDTLAGGWGVNTIYGDAGDDQLIASGPFTADILTGGTGNDTYQLPDIATETRINAQVSGADSGRDAVLFTGTLAANKLWMSEEARNDDGIANDLVIHVVGSAQYFVVENWQASDSQFDRLDVIAGESCTIYRNGISAIIAANHGIDPGLSNSNRNYWSCSPLLP